MLRNAFDLNNYRQIERYKKLGKDFSIKRGVVDD